MSREIPPRTVHMLSDSGTKLEFTAFDTRSRDQLLIDAGAFVSRMGNVHAQLVSTDPPEGDVVGTRVCPECDTEQTRCFFCRHLLEP